MAELKSYVVWDAGVRWFHWINVLSVLGLIAVGVVLMNDDALGLSNDGKVLLKTVHVVIGYAFALNLLWRFIWAFIGGPHARWRGLLPGGRGYLGETRRYIASLRAGRPEQFLGHNPLGRLAITVLLLLMLMMAVTGLILAGTDLFFPPLGRSIANWVAARRRGSGNARTVCTGHVRQGRIRSHARISANLVVSVHHYGFYVLLGVVLVHILAVVVTELRTGGNLVSAMFSGKKVLSQPPADKQAVG